MLVGIADAELNTITTTTLNAIEIRDLSKMSVQSKSSNHALHFAVAGSIMLVQNASLVIY